MVATVLVREKNGAGETPTDKTDGAARFKNADNATVDSADPLIVPTANREYSFEKVFRMHIGAVVPDTEITNLGFYMDGSKGWAAGTKLWGRGLAAYTTPAVPTETNDPPEIPVGGTPVAATDAFTWTSGAQLVLGAGPFSTINTDMGDYVYLVMEIEIAEAPGSRAVEQSTFEYDEL